MPADGYPFIHTEPARRLKVVLAARGQVPPDDQLGPYLFFKEWFWADQNARIYSRISDPPTHDEIRDAARGTLFASLIGELAGVPPLTEG